MGIASFQPPVTTPVKGTSLAEMLGMAQSAQALQQAQQLNPLQLQKAQLELQQAQSVNPLALRKATAETELAEKTLKPSIESKEAEAKRLKLVADQTGVDVTNHYANIARGVYGGLLTDPDFVSGNSKKMEEKLNKAKTFIEDLGIPMHESKIHDNLIQTVKQNPKEAYQLIKNGVQQAGTNAEQFGQVNAPAQYINTGQMQVPIYQSPYQGGGPGRVPAIQNVLPPTTQTINPQGQPGYLGPQNQQGFVPSALPPNAGLGTEDLQKTFADAQTAESRIGLLQNIKELAGKSFTGVGGSRKEFAAGLANAIGIPAYELEKANTDVLAKNSALLALTGGNTDAARALAEAANPNKKMNLEAIKDASNQLIAQERIKKAKADFIKPHINDPLTLQKKLLDFSAVNDFRLLQEMTPQQVKEMKQNMSVDERVEFKRKLDKARELGIVK
jgi:hypothetical protein